tara:strand:+ start:3049 stop:4197 length:1149 start_codon:yes stop_codon:yes gene_type:complete
MDAMLSPDKNYPFDKVKIKTPKALQGGTYCANLEINEGPVIIQTPKCKTKNGIHKTSKQIYCDLLMNKDHSAFLDWLETFQERIKNLILENSPNWFHEPTSLDEIEYNWNNSIRTRKDYYLIRSFVHKPKGINKISLQIYDTDENQLNIEQVKNDKNVICILEVIGLKFSSNSFHLEICLRQMMVINEKPLFNKCLIKLDSKIKNGENKEINNSLKEEKEEILEKNIEENNNQEKDPINNEIINNLVDMDVAVDTEENNVEEKDNEEIQSADEIKEETPKKQDLEFTENNDKDIMEKPLENTNNLEEIELNIQDDEPIQLKEAREVYLDIYNAAREKAKKAKNEAIKAYLEAKRIKELYMLDIVDSSSEEEEEEDEELFSEN